MSNWHTLPSTLAEIEALPTEVLFCKHVARVLQADPGTIHAQAMQSPELLGFPVIVTGTRVKIPKTAFLKFMRGEQP